MTNPRFFGYGSLVNLATHTYPDPTPATLPGWRRIWRHPRTHPVAVLSVHPHDSVLHGITAQVPNNDWAALDLREHAYARRDVSAHFNDPTAVYEAELGATDTIHPILLSYLDVVVGGYAALMPDGPAHFFATTTGWGPVANDRADPIYPRAQLLTPQVKSTVDDALAQLGVDILPADAPQIAAIRAAGPNT